MTAQERGILEKMERELNLKQLQIKSLLAITQAINENVSAEGLYNMYKTFMSWEMGVKKMALFIKDDTEWRCAITSHPDESVLHQSEMQALLLEYTRLHTIKETDHALLQDYDIIIPVYHKQTPIAYALIGGVKEQDDIYNKIQFITTITNIIAVALENKRLFKRQVEQETFKRELHLAGKVQRMLIPEELPQGKGFELAALYKPHSNIGGDYFDIIKYSETRFAFCIADVSGKGISAALLMANFQAILQSLIYQYRDLQTFIMALNDAVFRITKGDKYITLFVGELDLERKTLNYINAGNYPPFMRINGKIVRLDKGSTVVGAFQTLPFIEMGQEEVSGEGLILSFTDGLIDLKDEKGAYFGDEEIERVLGSNGISSADEFTVQLQREMDLFRGSQDFPDDIAVLTCKFKC